MFTLKSSLSSKTSKFKVAMNNMLLENRIPLITSRVRFWKHLFCWEQNSNAVFRVCLDPYICGGSTTCAFNPVMCIGGLFFFSLTQNLMWLRVMPPICDAALSEMETVMWLMARSGGAVVSTETLQRATTSTVLYKSW